MSAASLHAATVPHFLRQLPQMVALVDKAEAFCATNPMSAEDLLNARLAEDMWPLLLQFRGGWSHSADAIESALSGSREVDYTEPPADFAWLHQRLTQAVEQLQAVTPEQLERVEDGEVKISAGEHRFTFGTRDYLVHFALPNFYFHCSIAHAILRNQGLQIGKSDFLGPLPLKR